MTIRPFLTTIASPTRAFADALPVHPTGEVTSPWSPRSLTSRADTSVRGAELEAERARATAEGLEAGRRETAELRDKLAQVIARFEETQTKHVTKVADLVADAAIAVIEAWFERGVAERRELFAPIVRGWLQRTGDGANALAYVHPDDVMAMREAVGDALIAVEPDAQLAPGDVRVRGTDLELTHLWQQRLGELREAIATAAETTGVLP